MWLTLDVPCDFRVIKFIDEKEALLEQIKKLKAQLDERSKSGKAEKAASSDTILENGTDVQMIEVQRLNLVDSLGASLIANSTNGIPLSQSSG
ncbi:hypothetical protein scyTo_0014435 [Scyliorhinus torazame]|uniref:Uncharacterized protein n=1 Tax=Scyliorhinus torazame TaxID=75743 RepID=A0A401NML2_SCYTO|nr:hypothetical protein [Scyliorhinus torazame]